MRKALFVVNPISGRGEHGLVRARCVEAMAAGDLEVEVLETPGPGGTARAVGEYRGADFEMLVAGGGDGTVREVAEVAARLDLPLGIIPLGTSNSVVRELGLPLDPVSASRVAASGRERTVDMGEAGGVRFLLCLGAGLDADVIRRVHRGRQHGISKLSYVPATLGAFFRYEYPGIEVVIDGTPMPPGPFQVVVANARVYAGYFAVASEAEVDDGLLDVCLLYGGKWSLLRQGLRALRKRPLLARPQRHAGAGAIVLRAREIFIPGPPSAPVEIDGDPAAGLPQTVRVLPGALRVIVPGE
jgi:diacylglycerol kinase family enzyme